MLTNATIVRIWNAPVTGPDGSRAYGDGDSNRLRCSWQDPKSGRKWILGAEVADATACVYVQGNHAVDGPDLPAIAEGGQVEVLVDRAKASRKYLVLKVSPQVGLGLTNTEVYLKDPI